MSMLVKWIEELSLPQLGVVHVGAHEAQEAPDYAIKDLEPVIWVEAIPSLALRAKVKIKNYPSQSVVEAALWSKSGIVLNFNVASNDGGSSSFFKFHLHSASYPDVATSSVIQLQTKTLNEILKDIPVEDGKFGYLVLDVQGAELEVLQGGMQFLSSFIGIVAEVSLRELYKDAPLLSDVTAWLSSHEFELVACEVSAQTGWGDALFIRSDVVKDSNLSILHAHDVTVSNYLTFPTRIRIALVKLGINPKFFSKFVLNLVKKMFSAR